jgi:hypothetical protein
MQSGKNASHATQDLFFPTSLPRQQEKWQNTRIYNNAGRKKGCAHVMLEAYVCGGITQPERSIQDRESLQLLHILLCCTQTQAALKKGPKSPALRRRNYAASICEIRPSTHMLSSHAPENNTSVWTDPEMD